MKLHLGCGNVHLDGWVNIDYRYQPGVDVVDNIGILKRYEPESVDEIYASHCLDHFSRWDYPRVLLRWCELLKPGGTLRVSVVDFLFVSRMHVAGCPISELIGLLVAAQDYDGNVRHMHWDVVSLTDDMCAAGLKSVGEFEPFADDCSAWEFQGERFSLNLEGTK